MIKEKINKLIKLIKEDKYLVTSLLVGIIMMIPSFLQQPEPQGELTLTEIFEQPFRPSLENINSNYCIYCNHSRCN